MMNKTINTPGAAGAAGATGDSAETWQGHK